MKWISKPLGVDLNESNSKLNAREDNPDNLFEITPKFKIELEDEEVAQSFSKARKIFAVTAGGTEDPIGIALGSQLLILNKSRDAVEKTIDFKAPIDVVVWLRSVFIVGLANSEIILLCTYTFQIKESKRVSPNADSGFQDQFFIDAFIHSNPDPTKIDLLALGVNGLVYSFRNVSLVDGSSMDYTHDDLTLDIDLSTIKGTVRQYMDDSASVLCAASPSRNYIFAGEENGRLSVFQLMDEEDSRDNEYVQQYFNEINLVEYLEMSDETKIKKVVRCEGLLFVLFTNGHLEILLDDELFPTGGLHLPKPNYIVQDFAMIIQSTDQVKLWAILFNPEENESFIGIFPGPNFSPEFIARIPVPSDSAGEEGTVFSFPKQTNPFDEPTAIIAVEPSGWTTLYHMSESSTDMSLQNLLAKSRFEKAELLARKYGKDLDQVWKAKVRAKFNEVISGKTGKLVETAFRELIATLPLVRDAEFVCEFCTNREQGIPRLEWVKELLALGLKRVAECSSTLAGRTLLLTWKKLYTFDQVVRNPGVAEWNRFNDEENTMFNQCLWFLELNEFKNCEIVWLRHSDEFIFEIDLPHFAVFFKVLFERRLSSEDSISLFKTILPFAVEKCESETDMHGNTANIDKFMALIRSQIRSLERETQWPNEAIVFTKCLITIMQEEYSNLEEEKINTGEARIDKKLNICTNIFARLGKLLQALTELSNLKTAHSIRIDFEEYITKSVNHVVNSMLRLLFAKDEVERFVNKFLQPFAERNDLSMDTLLESHVQAAVEEVQFFINSGSIPFEERLVTLVGFIEAPKIKLACVLKMTEEWPVPWHPLMIGLVSTALAMKVGSDMECKDLQKTIRLMEIQVPYRCLIHKYRLTASKLSKSFGVYMALQRILKWKKSNCWEDCLELIKHTGRQSKDSVSTLKFWLELSLPGSQPSSEAIVNEFENNTTELKLRFLRRVLHKFRNAMNQLPETEDMWERFTECAKTLANQTEDDKTLEFLNLRKCVPNLWNDGIVHTINYPFSALELLLPQANSLTSSQLMSECDKLSVLTFFNVNDILITTAAFLTGPGNLGSAFQKVWDIVTRIVQSPVGFSGDSNEIVPNAGLEVAHYLILFAPTTSCEDLNTLFRFCVILEEKYEEVAEAIAKLHTVIWIFQKLREEEIPLEAQFLVLYKEIWREGLKTNQELQAKLMTMGEVILRFGNTDLLRQICNGIQQELMHQSTNLYGQGREKTIEAAQDVLNLKNKMLSEVGEFELPETNIRIKNLVKALADADLPMNAYALRERNKEKLIKKLLEMNQFPLAAQTALVFDFRDQISWSNILQEYITKASITELKTLLESLKKITDLWVLPEFSKAWLKVSEKFPNFKHMCPIPLNF